MPGTKHTRPTIRDVAREAGVSHQTVSRVLNAHPKVATGTRQRVLMTMQRLGYERNLAAQMLTTKPSQLIQVLTVDGKFPFDVPLLDVASQSAALDASTPDSMEGLGYSAVYTECSAQTLSRTLEIAAARMVDGVFLYAPKLQIDDHELLRICHGIPLVRRDFALNSRMITWVGFDQIRATQIAMSHLLELGHRDIAIITGSLHAINARWRFETWQKTLAEHNLPPGPHVHGDYTTRQSAMETGYHGMQQVLNDRQPFSAVLIANDYMALGVMHALREAGMRIPQDVSIVSFDNAPHAQFMYPPLTTVAFDFDLQNKLAFQFLFELMRHPQTEPHQHILLPNLVERDSTCAVT